jgi:hypothetical protein
MAPDSMTSPWRHFHPNFDFFTAGFMADAAMASFHAIRNVYGSEPLVDGKNVIDPEIGVRPPVEKTCGFHFEQSLVAHTKKHVVDKYQEEHLVLCRAWAKASNHAAFNELQNQIMEFWEDRAVLGFLSQAKISQWLSFWSKQSHHFAWYCIVEVDLSLDEEAFIPNMSMSEIVHTSMWVTQGNGRKMKIDLLDACMEDMTRSVLQQ